MSRRRNKRVLHVKRPYRRSYRRRNPISIVLKITGIILLLCLIVRVAGRLMNTEEVDRVDTISSERQANPEYWRGCPPIDAELLTPNSYSRPQISLNEINAIVIHYTANPGSSAMANRDYFEGLKDGTGTKASSHFIVGLDGEVVQCIPSAEVAYANHPRNSDTLSIECCHPDDSGKFNAKTRQSVVELSAWLCKAFHVDPDHIIRHYDVSGKSCPKYYVEHEDEWESLKADIKTQYDTLISG